MWSNVYKSIHKSNLVIAAAATYTELIRNDILFIFSWNFSHILNGERGAMYIYRGKLKIFWK